MLSVSTRKAKLLDQVFAALASERRRKIVHTLALNPASIGQLAGEQRMSLPAIHRHIKELEQAKLITRKKSGRTNFVAIRREGLLLAQAWLSQYSAYWGHDDETLDNYVASIERSGITH